MHSFELFLPDVFPKEWWCIRQRMLAGVIMIIYIIFLIKLKLYVLAWINWYLILATHFRKLIFIKLEFNSGIKDQPMFFLFRQKEPIRPAGGPPLRLFVRQCDHARLAQKWSAIELPTFLHWRADGITLLFEQISEAGFGACQI